MDKVERVKMVKAMEFIARQLNDEEDLESWVTYGVADGDIQYGDFFTDFADLDDMEYYIEDDTFSDLMARFLKCMKYAHDGGGLYCDGVVSK